jgi:hypothetical protein
MIMNWNALGRKHPWPVSRHCPWIHVYGITKLKKNFGVG